MWRLLSALNRAISVRLPPAGFGRLGRYLGQRNGGLKPLMGSEG